MKCWTLLFLNHLQISKWFDHHIDHLNSLKKVYIVNDFSMSFVVSNQLCNALFIYEQRLVVCLFCFVCTDEIHRTRMLQIVFLVTLKSSRWGGVHGLGSIVFGLVVQKFLNIEWFLHWKLNHSWNFQRSWNVPLVFLERSWWARFNGIYLVRFGFRMWVTLIFKWFLPLKIQINSKKPGFERKNQLKMWSNLGQRHKSH